MIVAFDMMIALFSVDKTLAQSFVANEKVIGEVFWNVAKVNRNELIEDSIKEKNETLGEILKQLVG